MARFTIVSAAMLAAATLAGCAAMRDARPTDRLIGEWRVEDVAGAGVTDMAALTVEFSETGQISGSAGCNRYTGAYSLDAATGALTVTPLGVTRRLCPGPLMLQEARFVDALQNARTVETQADGAAVLSSPAGRIVMRRRGPAPVHAAAATPAPAASTTTPAADPLAPRPADPMGAPVFTSTQPPPAAAPPPSTSSYPLAGDAAGAPLYPAAATPTPAPSTVTPAPAPLTTPAAPVPAARITAAGAATLSDALPLPGDATLRVQIRDVSRAGAPAIVLGEQSTPLAGAGPHAFAVTAPASVIAPNARLTLFAQVLSGNRLLYITDTANPVPVAGASGMAVRLVNVAPAPRVPATTPVAPAQTGLIPATPATPATPAPPATSVTPAPAATTAWIGDIPGARPFQCRNETFRLSFEEGVAFLTTADGAVARLARVGSDQDPGAPRMFSNSRLTLIKDVDSTGRERVRFARGRMGMVTCTAQ